MQGPLPAHGTANLRASHAAEAPVADLLDQLDDFVCRMANIRF